MNALTTTSANPQKHWFITTFYVFFPFEDTEAWKPRLKELMESRGVKGTILLAPEGINATLAGVEADVEAVCALVSSIPGAPSLPRKNSETDAMPFQRSVVKCKKEIIRFDYQHRDAAHTGKHVGAEEWNTLVDDPEVTVLDTRNSYEVHVGTFKGAVNPDIHHFTQLKEFLQKEMPPETHPKVATFCTGGVRCEKLTAWMMDNGYKEVFQLDGGILKYLEDMPAEQTRWEGDCYVFDERVAVTHGLAKAEHITMCPACGHALTDDDRSHEAYIPESACPYCG